MALPAEQVRATAQGLEYRPRFAERARALDWARLRWITAQVEPAWSGAEVTVTLGFAGATEVSDGIPLDDGQRLELFGDFDAARRLILTAQARAPQALVGVVAQLLVTLPRAQEGDRSWYEGRLKDYAFAVAAGVWLGRHYLWQGRLQAAERALLEVVRRDPLDAAAWRLLGVTRFLAGKGAAAQEALERLLGLGALDEEAHLLHGLSLYRQRRFDAAAQGLQRALRGELGQAAGGVLACALIQQGQIGEGLQQLRSLAEDRRQGWRLMARKCEICAEGYRAYQERVARDRLFRWKEQAKTAAAHIAGIIYALTSMLQYLFRRRGWAWLVGIVVVVTVLYLIERRRAYRGVHDQLADAQGLVPNMPCWYASLIWGGRRPLGLGRPVAEEILERLEGEA